jgi:PAS domain S-box-containing protein
MRAETQAWLGYGSAVAWVAAALGVALAATAQLQFAPYTLLFCAALFAAWFGGLGPGLLATALSVLAFDYFFIEPKYSLAVRDKNLLTLGVFTVAAALMVSVTAAHRRKRAEDESRRAERELQRIIDCIPIIAAGYDRDGRIDFVNQTWRDYTGTALENADRHRWGVAVHSDDLPLCESTWRAGLASGESFQLEHRIRRADGVYRWFKVNRVPFRDESGKVVRWYAAAYDIEDTRRAMDLLRRNETYLEVAQQLSRTGSLGWNVATGSFVWSKETFKIMGFEETVVPSLELVLLRTHPDDRAFVQSQVDSVARGQKNFEFEHRLLLDAETIRHVHVRARKVTYPSGAEEILGAVMDVTEAKLAQAALGRVQTELAHANRVASLGEMSASIAHEVNQPLGAIAINGEVLLRLLSRQPPNISEAMAAARQIVGDAHRATAVVRRTRELSKKAEAEMVRLDLNAVVNDAVELVRREALQSGANVRTLLTGVLPPVRGDRIQLQQVILNLSINGLQAMASISGRERLLTVHTQKHEPDQVLVAIEDVGTGADPETAGRLFEAFYTTKQHGLGIGLSICRSIVEAHGGRIWASSNEGPGMTFCFTVPIYQ